MKQVIKHIKTYALLYLGTIIYLLFYISAAKTGWFDIFFSGAALHNGAKGIDFYQLLQGAWAYWHGGSLTGKPLSDGAVYVKESYPINGNVYHPLLTLTLGSLLIQFDPATAYYVWLWAKLPLSLLAAGYFYWSFRKYRYVQFATFVLLVNFSAYLELAAGQFHLLLNICILLFLCLLAKKKLNWSGGIYWLSLLVKPVGLLFLPILVIKRYWPIALIGVFFFTFDTWIWIAAGPGSYYLDNLSPNIFGSWYPGPDQIITLRALLHFSTHWPDISYIILQAGVLCVVLFLSALQRIHTYTAIFLFVAYFLCFYTLVYEYDWSTLAYVLPLCIICCPSFQTRFSRFCILLTSLPSCFLVLRLLHIGIMDKGDAGFFPDEHAWKLMIVSKLLPLGLLCVSVLVADIKPIVKQMKMFFAILQKTNAELKIFGRGEA